jgi:hypothetical protein
MATEPDTFCQSVTDPSLFQVTGEEAPLLPCIIRKNSPKNWYSGEISV